MKDADKAIIGKLKEAGRIIHVAVEHHSYPFCWRSDTPLIYRVSRADLHRINRFQGLSGCKRYSTPWERRAVIDLFDKPHLQCMCRRCPAGS